MDNKSKKIAIVLSTPTGLENDDRIRKEVLSINKMGHFHVKIFARVSKNEYQEGVTSYGTPFKYLYLRTRDIFPSGKFLPFKIMEMYFKLRKELTEYDIIWCADHDMFIFPLLLKKIVIWDLHEIPELFLKNKLTIKLFHYLENKCKTIIHANSYRLDYLIEHGLVTKRERHLTIRNYPDKVFIESKLIPYSHSEMQYWLNGSKYVYLQGISSPERHPYNSITAIIEATDLKMIVSAGKLDANTYDILIKRYGIKLFNEKIYFTGMLDQLFTPFVIKKALFSMVFYAITSSNQRFCEPNRFYQSLVFGIPVICGCNEPLKDIIEKYNCGICIKSDGSDKNEIINAITKLLNNYDFYRQNAIAVQDLFVWNDNDVAKILH
jgi:glycosyltransferase involved in cell wall biosynthesis